MFKYGPYWFELNWWFPQLAMLFVIASVVVGFVARMGEKEVVRLITRGAADMLGPAMVILLAAGVSVIMTNTQTLDTILNSMEQLTSGASAGVDRCSSSPDAAGGATHHWRIRLARECLLEFRHVRHDAVDPVA